jgi:hypothetical protein
MKRRLGVSLVELLAVLSGLTVILSMSATLLTRMMHTQSETRRFFENERRAMDLSQQFRADVHQARSSVTEEPQLKAGEIVQLQFEGGQTAIYRREADAIWRILSKDGQPASREEFQLGSAQKTTVRQLESPPRLELLITTELDPPPPGPSDPPARVRDNPVSIQTEAVLGRDGRYAKPLSQEKAP